MSQTHVDAIRRAIDGINRGSTVELESIVHPDIRWDRPRNFPDANPLFGWPEVKAFVETGLLAWTGFHIEVEDITPNGNRILVTNVQSAQGHASGATVSNRLYHVWTFDDSGRTIRFQALNDEDAARREAGLRTQSRRARRRGPRRASRIRASALRLRHGLRRSS